jgi:hypothetical protein
MTKPYCSFQVGDKVSTITEWDERPYMAVPRVGEVYTVREVRAADGNIGITLAEITNPKAHLKSGIYGEPAYVAAFFRRVISTDNQVSALKKIVSDVFQNDQVPA